MSSLSLRSTWHAKYAYTTSIPIDAGCAGQSLSLQLSAGGAVSLIDRLPVRPYCMDGRGDLRIRDRAEALESRLIQVNAGGIAFLPFDIDKPDIIPVERCLLPPTWRAVNPENGHAHIVYALRHPVLRASRGAMEYAQAIGWAMGRSLSADAAYSGLLTKNPFCNDWITEYNPDAVYDLPQLHACLEGSLPSARERREARAALIESGQGRNCSLFDSLRRHAYRAERPGEYEIWHEHLLRVAQDMNAHFAMPLSHPEVRSVAKSVARYTWDHRRAGRTSAAQAARGSQKGKQGRKRIQDVASEHPYMSAADIALQAGVSEATVKRFLAGQRKKLRANVADAPPACDSGGANDPHGPTKPAGTLIGIDTLIRHQLHAGDELPEKLRPCAMLPVGPRRNRQSERRSYLLYTLGFLLECAPGMRHDDAPRCLCHVCTAKRLLLELGGLATDW